MFGRREDSFIAAEEKLEIQEKNNREGTSGRKMKKHFYNVRY